MSYFVAYLDEFGHIGPFIGRNEPKYNESPAFGLGGYIIPLEQVRDFGSWFFRRKSELLAWEIQRSGLHPAHFEKKGSALYTALNVEKSLSCVSSRGDSWPICPSSELQYFSLASRKRAISRHTMPTLFTSTCYARRSSVWISTAKSGTSGSRSCSTSTRAAKKF
jgi:hypothetical protein